MDEVRRLTNLFGNYCIASRHSFHKIPDFEHSFQQHWVFGTGVQHKIFGVYIHKHGTGSGQGSNLLFGRRAEAFQVGIIEYRIQTQE
jgi:hypothetical protein